MTQSKLVEGKVVLVTGAGRGIGRDIALLMAQEGAKVVVNDLGGAADGEGNGNQSPAQLVVEEIEKAGGSAIANFDSVAEQKGAQAMVDQAVRHYGRIDCVVNNAGILRDRIFHKMSHMDWQQVLAVHLGGCFNTSRAAANYFKEQQSGSFIHFTSAGGLIGNFGQANYMAAKMGIVGLSTSIALDMQRYNVRSNCIAPHAWSRLAGTIPSENEESRVNQLKQMSPAKIAPICVYLASDHAHDVSGQVFGVRQNEIFLYSLPRPIRSVHTAEGWSPRSVFDVVMPALKPSFQRVERVVDVFKWDPI